MLVNICVDKCVGMFENMPAIFTKIIETLLISLNSKITFMTVTV